MLLFIVFPASRRVHHRSPARHLRRTVDPSGFCTAVPVHCHVLTFPPSLTGPGILLAREPMAEAGAEQELKRLCCGVAHGLIRAWAALPPWDLERPREVGNTGAREHDGADELKDLPNDIEQFSFPATSAPPRPSCSTSDRIGFPGGGAEGGRSVNAVNNHIQRFRYPRCPSYTSRNQGRRSSTRNSLSSALVLL